MGRYNEGDIVKTGHDDEDTVTRVTLLLVLGKEKIKTHLETNCGLERTKAPDQ